jgi:hypothetical protein
MPRISSVFAAMLLWMNSCYSEAGSVNTCIVGITKEISGVGFVTSYDSIAFAPKNGCDMIVMDSSNNLEFGKVLTKLEENRNYTPIYFRGIGRLELKNVTISTVTSKRLVFTIENITEFNSMPDPALISKYGYITFGNNFDDIRDRWR